MENQQKRRKIHDTEEEFRSRLVGILEYEKEHLYLFVDVEVHKDQEFMNKYNHEDISNAISRNREQKLFRNTIHSLSQSKTGKSKLWNLYLRYFPEAVKFDSFVEDLLHRFYRGNWPISEYYDKSRREEEEEFLQHMGRLTHVTIFERTIPVEIGMIILEYLHRDFELICGLGLVDEKWYRLVLESWRMLKFYDRSVEFGKIPCIVLKNVNVIEVIWNRHGNQSSYANRISFQDYFSGIFTRIDPTKLVGLNVRRCFVRPRHVPSSLDFVPMLEFPNLRWLKCSHCSSMWKILSRFKFPRLRSFQGELYDFKYLCNTEGYNYIRENLSSVTLSIRFQDDRPRTWASATRKPRKSYVLSNLTSGMEEIYKLKNLKKLFLFLRGYGGGKGYFVKVGRPYIGSCEFKEIPVDLSKFTHLEEFGMIPLFSSDSAYRIDFDVMKLHSFVKSSKPLALKRLIWSLTLHNLGMDPMAPSRCSMLTGLISSVLPVGTKYDKLELDVFVHNATALISSFREDYIFWNNDTNFGKHFRRLLDFVQESEKKCLCRRLEVNFHVYTEMVEKKSKRRRSLRIKRMNNAEKKPRRINGHSTLSIVFQKESKNVDIFAHMLQVGNNDLDKFEVCNWKLMLFIFERVLKNVLEDKGYLLNRDASLLSLLEPYFDEESRKGAMEESVDFF